MVEIILEGLPANVEEGTIQNWYFEEGDPVNEGDELVELTTEEGPITVQASKSGILAEVYYDEGEVVAKGEVLCTIDDEESEDKDEEDKE
ncbi:MAG: biotin/lipoyl-binding protein [Candidatus Omnitrophica bacterium]|nr:biotin/lipoyl-binding protein [Candidatus Omnitrophota bacterium]